MPGAFTEMIPPGGSDFAQLWSVGPFLAAVVEGLAGVRPGADARSVEVAPQLPAGLDWFTLENVRFGDHELKIDVRRDGKKVVTTVAHVRGGPAHLTVTFVPATPAAEVLRDGKPVTPVTRRVERLDREVGVVMQPLPAGRTVVFAE